MKTIVREAMFAGIAGLAVVVAWQIVAIMLSDTALGRGDPAAALRARPGNPEALMRLASTRFVAGDLAAAEGLARRLLEAAPADGRGYRLLAQVAEARGQQDRTATFYAIAARRSPGDLRARAWLAQRAFAAGDYPTALQHIDRVLRTSGSAQARLFPVLAELAENPAFADALAQALATRPPWRDGLLATLHSVDQPGTRAADQVLAGLQRRNALDPGTSQAWIEALIRQNRWAEAFARWSSPHTVAGRRLPLLFNGDFAEEPEGAGFDWRIPSVAGVVVSIEPRKTGRALHLRFLGRRIPGGPLASHALLLAPGPYEMQWLEQMDSLRADEGLAWQVSCAGQPQPLAQADSSMGSRTWLARTLVFTVPAGGCNGQWLQLASSGNAEAGQVVSGGARYATFQVFPK